MSLEALSPRRQRNASATRNRFDGHRDIIVMLCCYGLFEISYISLCFCAVHFKTLPVNYIKHLQYYMEYTY
jgi:hypothetical protein